jgi:hypothetical protein
VYRHVRTSLSIPYTWLDPQGCSLTFQEDTLEINDMERKRTPVRGGGKASESDESLDRDDIKELNTSQIHLV